MKCTSTIKSLSDKYGQYVPSFCRFTIPYLFQKALLQRRPVAMVTSSRERDCCECLFVQTQALLKQCEKALLDVFIPSTVI